MALDQLKFRALRTAGLTSNAAKIILEMSQPVPAPDANGGPATAVLLTDSAGHQWAVSVDTTGHLITTEV